MTDILIGINDGFAAIPEINKEYYEVIDEDIGTPTINKENNMKKYVIEVNSLGLRTLFRSDLNIEKLQINKMEILNKLFPCMLYEKVNASSVLLEEVSDNLPIITEETTTKIVVK